MAKNSFDFLGKLQEKSKEVLNKVEQKGEDARLLLGKAGDKLGEVKESLGSLDEKADDVRLLLGKASDKIKNIKPEKKSKEVEKKQPEMPAVNSKSLAGLIDKLPGRKDIKRVGIGAFAGLCVIAWSAIIISAVSDDKESATANEYSDNAAIVSESVEAETEQEKPTPIEVAQETINHDFVLDVTFEDNIVDATYDVVFYVDEGNAELKYDTTEDLKALSITEGNHTLKVCKADDETVVGTEMFAINEDSILRTTVSRHKKDITFQNTEMLPITNLTVPTLLGAKLDDALKQLKEIGLYRVEYSPSLEEIGDQTTEWIVKDQSLSAHRRVKNYERIVLSLEEKEEVKVAEAETKEKTETSQDDTEKAAAVATTPAATQIANAQPDANTNANADSTTNGSTKANDNTNSGTEGGNSNFNTYDNTDNQNTTETWVLNTSSKKIHHPTCNSVPKIAPHNYATSSESLDELKARGYVPCKNCFK